MENGDLHKKIFMLGLHIIFLIALFIVLKLCDPENTTVLALIGIFEFAWMFFTWYKITKTIVNVYLFFLILSFCFYLGQPLLFLFGANFDNVMAIQNSQFTKIQIDTTLIFLLKSMGLFHLGGLLSIKRYKENRTFKFDEKSIIFVGMLLFAISVVPQLQSTFSDLKTTLTVGYAGIFKSDFNTGTGLDGGIPRFLAGFFKSSLLLLILGNKNNRKKLNFWMVFSIIISILAIISGQRGANSLFIIGIAMLYHYAIKPFTKKHFSQFSIVIVFGIVAFSLLSIIRNMGSSGYNINNLVEIISTKNSFVDMIAEMGFTLIACTTVMVFCPWSVPYNYGATYYKSLFSLIPNLFWDVNPAANGGVDQVFKSFLFQSSGMGSSFIIEGYYNFGTYALLLMPLFGYLVGKLYFDTIYATKNKDYLKLYMCVYISFIILWYVRSETITFWRNFVYYALMPVILIKIKTAFEQRVKYSINPLALRGTK